MSILQRFKRNVLNFGCWSSPVAGMIDRAYQQQSSGFFSALSTFIKVRLLYTFLFLPLSVADLMVSGTLGLRYALATFFTTDELQDDRLENQKHYTALFSKNLWSLAAFVFGLMNPKLVSFYFTPDRTDVPGVEAGGDYYRDPHAVKTIPENKQDVVDIIMQAAADGMKVMPMGAGRSQGKQFLPDTGEKSIILDLSQLKDIVIDDESKTVTVGAGALWSDIQQAANHKKLALQVMQASNVFSVGGSIGTNIHGWDHIQGVLANTIVEMVIINARGEEVTLTPENALFHHIMGGMGQFGVVVSVKLQLTDNELMQEVGKQVAPAEYVNHFRENVAGDDAIGMHLYRLSLDPSNMLGEGVAVDYRRQNPGVGVKADKLLMEPQRGRRFDRVMANVARRSGLARQLYWNSEVSRLTTGSSAAISRNEIMGPPINAMFNPAVSESEWLQEYFLPPETLAAFLQELGKILTDNDIALLNASVRYVPQYDKSPFSYARAGERFAVVLCFNQSLNPSAIVKAEKWLRLAQKLTVQKGGSFYLPYQHVSSPEDLAQSYPDLAKAREMKQIVDPYDLFSSGFSRKYLFPKESDTPDYFRQVFQNDDNKKKFRGFLEGVFKQVDAEPLYHLLDDILEYKDSHAEVYQELCRRLPEIKPGMVGGLRRILKSLSAIKTDLGQQAQELLPADWQSIDGLVEIGYPGRFINGFKEHYQVIGTVAAVYEQPGLTDYVQSGYPSPYGQFVKLDYAKPSLSELKDNSADLITCYVGLHHFPDNELDAFLIDIRRVLRDGGRFLLVDHDVVDEDSMAMAHMAHTIFNAVTGVSLQEEMSELRHFRPISEWRERLAKQGLASGDKGPDVSMIREGDPSRNRMICVTKPKAKPVLSPLATLQVKQDDSEIGSHSPQMTQEKSPTPPPSPTTSNMGIFSLTSRYEINQSLPDNDESLLNEANTNA